MVIEYGGHRLASFLPRELFKKIPICSAWPAEADRRFQLLPSSVGPSPLSSATRRNIFANTPTRTSFMPGPMIYSARLVLVSEVRALHAVRTGAARRQCRRGRFTEGQSPRAAFLPFYYDTEDVPRKVKPLSNVCMLWAPRKRCYAHRSFGRCLRRERAALHARFRRPGRLFPRHGARPARVFEYYLDAILFKSVLPPLAGVMRRDLVFYRAAGAHTIQALMRGDFPGRAPSPTRGYSRAWHGMPTRIQLRSSGILRLRVRKGAAAAMASYFGSLEKAFALALEISPAMKLPKCRHRCFGSSILRRPTSVIPSSNRRWNSQKRRPGRRTSTR